MKKILFIAALAFAGLGAFAQDSNTMYMKNDTSGSSSMNNGKMKNYFTLMNGKVQLVKDGISSPLSADQTLKDGTTIKTDGTIMMKNGKTKTLKEGERFYMDGRMGSKMKNGDMSNKTDSTGSPTTQQQQ